VYPGPFRDGHAAARKTHWVALARHVAAQSVDGLRRPAPRSSFDNGTDGATKWDVPPQERADTGEASMKRLEIATTLALVLGLSTGCSTGGRQTGEVNRPP